MTKQEFLTALRKGLSGLPQSDVEERVSFYNEMIEDRMEEGLSEEEAVAGVGPVEEVISQIVSETPLSKIVKEKVRSKRKLGPGVIALLVLGSPIWLALLISAAAIIFSGYVVLWSLVISLWAVEISLAAAAVGGVVLAILFGVRGSWLRAAATLGGSLVCGGLAILLAPACVKATTGSAKLGKKMWVKTKSLFLGKEE